MARGARERVSTVFRLAVFLGQNPISLTGAILTTSAAITLLVFWIYLIIQARPIHPYASIVFFLILPAVFALGLVLMPIGGYLQRRKLRAQGRLPREYP